MNRIKISICIATLNRAAFIGATLETIISQATDEVEIVIVEGASTDNTGEIIRRYQECFPRLRYFRQDANRGVDHDFAEAVAMAHGEYCWLFSDDDFLKPGAIQAVLDAIKGQYGLIIANAEVRNADLSKVLEPKRLKLSADRIYKPTEIGLLLAEVGDYLTFIGGVVIKRELWNAREKEKHFGSYFVHAGVIFQSPLPEDTLVIAKPLVSIRYGNASWLGKYFEIWMFKWPDLIWSFPDYPDSVKLQACPKEPWRRMRTLLLARAKGAFTIKEYREWLEPRLDSSWTRAMARAIAQFPGRLANFLAIFYYHAFWRQPSRVFVISDLENSPFYFWKWRKRRPRAANASIP
jgi:glycosyltransferase involved in cell wall biosynthesis